MKWVKTQDEMPEPGVSVLTWCGDFGFRVMYGGESGPNDEWQWSWDTGETADPEKGQLPTHWTALPEPPR